VKRFQYHTRMKVKSNVNYVQSVVHAPVHRAGLKGRQNKQSA